MNRSFVLCLILTSALVGCAGPEPEPLPAPELDALGDEPTADPSPKPVESRRPTQGPLAKLAQAMKEAEAETERARKATARVKLLEEQRAELKRLLQVRTRERDRTRQGLAKAKKELRQNMARLLDSEMARVRLEQELLRRKIEVEERRRTEAQ